MPKLTEIFPDIKQHGLPTRLVDFNIMPKTLVYFPDGTDEMYDGALIHKLEDEKYIEVTERGHTAVNYRFTNKAKTEVEKVRNK